MAADRRDGKGGVGVGPTMFGILNIGFYCDICFFLIPCESRLLCVKRDIYDQRANSVLSTF